jgi:hypothetical protein
VQVQNVEQVDAWLAAEQGWKREHVRQTKESGERLAVKPLLGNIKCAIVGTYRSVRRKHIARTRAEFEWRFNHRTHLAAMHDPDPGPCHRPNLATVLSLSRTGLRSRAIRRVLCWTRTCGN